MAAPLASIRSLWLVGGGNMGSALLSRWLQSGLSPAVVTLVDPAPKSVPEGVRAFSGVESAPGTPDIVVLAIKPQMLEAVAPALKLRIGNDCLLLSVLAGVAIVKLREALGGNVVRAMPNTPARIGQGTSALHGPVPEGARQLATALMAAAGHVHWLEDESLFDAVTGVSGSGPAYVFRFVEALETAGIAAGLPHALAADLALETVAGAAALAAARESSPRELREQVTSPNGTTAAGLAVLDGDGDLSRLLEATVAAAAHRSRELGG